MKLMYAMVEYNGNMQSYDLVHHEYDENYEEKNGETEEETDGDNQQGTEQKVSAE